VKTWILYIQDGRELFQTIYSGKKVIISKKLQIINFLFFRRSRRSRRSRSVSRRSSRQFLTNN
jgi:hypothetical protein